jgi:hypothetical protein
VISIAHYGFNLFKLADVLFDHHCQATRGVATGCLASMNVGGNIAISEEASSNHAHVDKQAEELKTEWRQAGSDFPHSLKQTLLHHQSANNNTNGDDYKHVVERI